MQFPAQPESVLTSDTSPFALPDPETAMDRLTKPAVNRMTNTASVAAMVTPMSETDFRNTFAVAMYLLNDQSPMHRRDNRYLSVGPTKSGSQVFVYLHTTIPKFSHEGYVSEGMQLVGVYQQFAGVRPDFPGMVVSRRGVILGNPDNEDDPLIEFGKV